MIYFIVKPLLYFFNTLPSRYLVIRHNSFFPLSLFFFYTPFGFLRFSILSYFPTVVTNRDPLANVYERNEFCGGAHLAVRQAEFFVDEHERIAIRNLSSNSDTFLNGKRIDRNGTAVEKGDIIHFANNSWTILDVSKSL